LFIDESKNYSLRDDRNTIKYRSPLSVFPGTSPA